MQSPLRVLHLEDDARDAELLQAKLEGEGIVSHITRVDSQADFLASLKHDHFDVIIADYALPSFDGLSALKIALEKCPDLPFIFVSGAMGEEVAIEALKIGATDYVLKERLSRIVPSVRRALREAQEKTERKRAEAELRESEQKYRTLFDSIDEGFCTIEVLFDEDDKPVDYSFLQINPSFERQTGIQNVIGRRMREIAPRHEAHWFEIYGTIALTGEPMRFENEAKELGRWYDVYAFRVDDPKLRRVGILFKDITERKRAEEELRQAQAAKFEIQLETQVRERTRIAKVLNDTLLQNFQGLLLRFQSVLKVLPEHPLEARQRLESAIAQAAQAITDARDAIQGLRPLAAETGDLARAITDVAEELKAQSTDPDPPAIVVDVEGEPRTLNPVVRDETYRIAGEALRNAFRHARARRITVEIGYDKRQFRLRVRDDGKGIDQDTIRRQVPGHFGMHGMSEQAETVGGRLEVWSKHDSGTEVELSIPGEIAYDTPVDRSWFSKVLSRKSRTRARSHE